jgi:hypothetical protein
VLAARILLQIANWNLAQFQAEGIMSELPLPFSAKPNIAVKQPEPELD